MTPRPATVDFETQGIERRPAYPPEPVGVSILLPSETRAQYYAWGHPEKNNCTKAQAVRALREAWDCPDGVLFHNSKFDYDVAVTRCGMRELSWTKLHDSMFLLFLHDPHAKDLGLKPSAERILGMAPDERDAVREWLVGNRVCRDGKEWGEHISKAPGDLVGKYANGDVLRTRKLFKVLWPKVKAAGMLDAYDRERRLMPILLANEREGVRVDTLRMEKWIKLYDLAAAEADNWLRKRLKAPELNIDSDRELADVLSRAGVVREWALTPTGQLSVAKDALTPDRFSDPRVASVLGYRNRLNTVLGTFIKPWHEMARANGRIYTSWHQVRNTDAGKGARTGRLSTSPNFQNIPKSWDDKGDGYTHPTFLKLPELPLLRQLVLPEKGDVLLRRDYNQQELRILAHFEDDKLLEKYIDDPRLDVHTFVQQEIARLIGRDFERRAVKVLNFGMLYGMGLGTLAKKVDCTVEDARLLRQGQRQAIPGLFALDKALKVAGSNGEPIRTWGGRLYHKEPPIIKNGRTMDFGYKLLNYLIQGSAADCTKEALIRYDEAREHGALRLCVHDEIDVSVPKGKLKRESELLDRAMSSVEFDCPLLTDAESGPTWGAMK